MTSYYTVPRTSCTTCRLVDAIALLLAGAVAVRAFGAPPRPRLFGVATGGAAARPFRPGRPTTCVVVEVTEKSQR